MDDTKSPEAVRSYQRVLTEAGVDPPRTEGPWEPVVMEVDGEAFSMARWPDGSTAGIRTALAMDRFTADWSRRDREIHESLRERWRRDRVEMDALCADLVTALNLIPARDLVMPAITVTVTDALAHLRRPKREGNRAERRAAKRR